MSDIFSDSLQTAIATQQEYRLPSIFEIFAQENLRSSVRPAFEHLVKVISANNPERFGWLAAWYDEAFTALELMVQHHFLLAHMASYSEMYYGLRRKIKGLAVQSHSQLDSRRHWWSLFSLCIFPYMEIKLKKEYERTTERISDSARNHKLTVFGKLFLWLYPVFTTGWNIWRLYLLFKYTIQENKYPDPFFKILRIKLVIEDPSVSSGVRSTLSSILTKMISGGVHAGVFILQFMEWWYSGADRHGSQKIKQSSIPPPPSADADDYTRCNTECPLCHRIRTNDTALVTSGYVFCYVCIYKHVTKNESCPITKIPTSLEQLVKLYPPE